MLAGLLWFLGYASWSVLLLHLSDTGPSVALTTCPVWLLLRAWQASFFNARRYVLAGVAFALAALVRPVVGLYVIILGVGMFFWFAVRRRCYGCYGGFDFLRRTSKSIQLGSYTTLIPVWYRAVSIVVLAAYGLIGSVTRLGASFK